MDIQASLNEILQAKDEFSRLFYQRFRESNPKLGQLFAALDVKRQTILLTTALMVIERFYSQPTPAIELYMRYLGTKHNELGIGTEEFPKFFACLLQTLKTFHGERWQDAVEQQWREAFDRTTSTMFEGYLERVRV
jgi:hemoglobin-like flavoprotein